MVQSIDRAMQIIQILSSNPNKMELTITELVESTGLPFSTVHRLLSSLIQHGLVRQISTKQYKLGYAWIEIGMRLLESIDLRVVARPVMERLALDVEESIYLNIPSGVDGITIEIVDSPLKVRIAETLGIRLPLNIGAPNKVMLAFMKEKDQASIISHLQLTSKEKEDLINQLLEIQKLGYAISYGERTEGTVSLSSPVIGYSEKVMAAVSINAPSFRVTNERLPLLILQVKAAAEEISKRIGGVIV